MPPPENQRQLSDTARWVLFLSAGEAFVRDKTREEHDRFSVLLEEAVAAADEGDESVALDRAGKLLDMANQPPSTLSSTS